MYRLYGRTWKTGLPLLSKSLNSRLLGYENEAKNSVSTIFQDFPFSLCTYKIYLIKPFLQLEKLIIHSNYITLHYSYGNSFILGCNSFFFSRDKPHTKIKDGLFHIQMTQTREEKKLGWHELIINRKKKSFFPGWDLNSWSSGWALTTLFWQ